MEHAALGWDIAARMATLAASLAVGVALGHALEALGWARYLAPLARPLTRLGRLPDSCGGAFVLAFLPGPAAGALLYRLYEEGRLTRRELRVAAVLNTFPRFFAHLPSTFGVVVPLLGWVGAAYLGLSFAVGLVTSILVLAANRLLPDGSRSAREDEADAPEQKKLSWSEAGRRAWRGMRRRVWLVLRVALPVYLLVLALKELGAFEAARDFLAVHLPLPLVPVEGLSIIAAQSAQFLAGCTVAAGLLAQGALSAKGVLISLMMGNIISSPLRALRHSLPSYAGIYTPRFGAQIILVSQSIRVCVTLVMVYALYRLW